MRRSFVFALATAVPLAATVTGLSLFAHGCSSEPALDSLCAWVADPGNCYREFRHDMVSGVNPNGDCQFANAAAPTEVNLATSDEGTHNGSFLMRPMLDICVIDSGGQVVFDPPIDLTKIPPSPLDLPISYKIKLLKSDGTECGSLGYTSPHGFSITIDAPPDAGSSASSSGSVMSTPLVDGGVPEYSGSYTQVIAGGRDVFDSTCPSGEAHHFNLDEVIGPLSADGKSNVSPCVVFQNLVPTARLVIDPGSIDTPGAVSFAIDYPPVTGTFPSKADILNPGTTSPVPPDTIVYFNCRVPGAPETCQNGVKDTGESDIDCGGPQVPVNGNITGSCPLRCMDGQQCNFDCDCNGNACVVNTMTGMKTCDTTKTGQFTMCGYDDKGTHTPGGGGTGGGSGTGGASSSSAAASSSSTGP